MKSRKLSVTEVQRPEESPRAIEDILSACLIRGANIATMIDVFARAEAFQGTPADCMEALAELMERLNDDISEAQELCELRVQSSGGTR